jgi:hypothetical protein
MPTKTKPSFTVKDFYSYEHMALGSSTDGALPVGALRLYKVSKTGKLTERKKYPEMEKENKKTMS